MTIGIFFFFNQVDVAGLLICTLSLLSVLLPRESLKRRQRKSKLSERGKLSEVLSRSRKCLPY